MQLLGGVCGGAIPNKLRDLLPKWREFQIILCLSWISMTWILLVVRDVKGKWFWWMGGEDTVLCERVGAVFFRLVGYVWRRRFSSWPVG